MQDQKDRFGEKLRLVRQARENVYFAEKNRRLIEQLRARLQKDRRPSSKSKESNRTAPDKKIVPRIYLVPVDFSKGSEVALKHAVGIAREGDGRLLLLHVLNESIFYSGAILLKVYVEIMEKQARESLKKMARRTRLQPIEYEAVHVWGRDTARTIANYAKKLKASMIIMGSFGRTGLSRLVLGSVAERTLRYAECPVLVVKK